MADNDNIFGIELRLKDAATAAWKKFQGQMVSGSQDIKKQLELVTKSTEALHKTLRLTQSALALVGIGVGLNEIRKQFFEIVSAAASARGAAAKLGTTVESYSRLRFAGLMAHVDVDTLTLSLKNASVAMVDAANGADKLAERSFRRLGIDVHDAAVQASSMVDLLPQIADGFKSVTSAQEKLAIAQQLFGRNSLPMFSLLKNGSQGLQAMANDADRLHATMSTALAVSASAVDKAFIRMGLAVEGFKSEFAVVAMPAIAAAVNTLADLIGRVTGMIESDSGEAADYVADIIEYIVTVTIQAGGAIAQVLQYLKLAINGLKLAFQIMALGAVQGWTWYLQGTKFAVDTAISLIQKLATAYVDLTAKSVKAGVAIVAWWTENSAEALGMEDQKAKIRGIANTIDAVTNAVTDASKNAITNVGALGQIATEQVLGNLANISQQIADDINGNAHETLDALKSQTDNMQDYLGMSEQWAKRWSSGFRDNFNRVKEDIKKAQEDTHDATMEAASDLLYLDDKLRAQIARETSVASAPDLASRAIEQIRAAYNEDVTRWSDALEQKKIKQEEFDKWLVARQNQLSIDLYEATKLNQGQMIEITEQTMLYGITDASQRAITQLNSQYQRDVLNWSEALKAKQISQEAYDQWLVAREEELAKQRARINGDTTDAFRDGIEAWKTSIGTNYDQIKSMTENLLNTFTDGFGQAFGDAIAGVKSLDEAFRQMAASVLSEIGKIIAKMIALKIISGFFGGGGQGSGFSDEGTSFGNAATGAIWHGGFTPFAGGSPRIDRPTLGLVGEGKYPEAIVPLPDGRRIPVNLRLSGAGSGQSVTNVTVEQHLHFSGLGDAEFARMLSANALPVGRAAAEAVKRDLSVRATIRGAN